MYRPYCYFWNKPQKLCVFILIDIARLLFIQHELIYGNDQNTLLFFILTYRMCYRTFQSLSIRKVKQRCQCSFSLYLFSYFLSLDFFHMFKNIWASFHFIIRCFYLLPCIQYNVSLFYSCICVLGHHLSLWLFYRLLEGQYLAFLFVTDSLAHNTTSSLADI